MEISRVGLLPIEQEFVEIKETLSHRIASIVRSCLPKTWFCWLSRTTIQVQAIVLPHKWSYWTELTQDLYLGAMPLRNLDHINKITSLGCSAILSINESFEFNDQLFGKPVSESYWTERHVTFLNIPSPDLAGVEVEKIAVGVRFVMDQINLGKKVYVHCTAGRGRSSSIAICALVKINGYTLEESMDRVKRARPQTMLGQRQLITVTAWYQRHLLGLA